MGTVLKSLQEHIDTTTSGRKVIFHIVRHIGRVCEWDIIRERTMAGLKAARAKGRQVGRPRRLKDKEIRMTRTMWNDKKNIIRKICGVLKVSRATFLQGS